MGENWGEYTLSGIFSGQITAIAAMLGLSPAVSSAGGKFILEGRSEVKVLIVTMTAECYLSQGHRILEMGNGQWELVQKIGIRFGWKPKGTVADLEDGKHWLSEDSGRDCRKRQDYECDDIYWSKIVTAFDAYLWSIAMDGFLDAWKAGKVGFPSCYDSLAPEIAPYVSELIIAREVLHKVRRDDNCWQEIEALSPNAKTVILAHQIPKIFAIGFYREPLEKLEHQARIWERCGSGNRMLWEAVGILLKGARGKIESPLPPRAPRAPRQHRQCYKCKHMHHVTEFVLMTGEPGRKSSLCRSCYWNYENKRLDDLRYWERQYRVLYQKWFGPEWRLAEAYLATVSARPRRVERSDTSLSTLL